MDGHLSRNFPLEADLAVTCQLMSLRGFRWKLSDERNLMPTLVELRISLNLSLLLIFIEYKKVE